MFNGVESFKEKLRSTLSEPNSSSEKSRKSDSRGSEIGLAKAKSAGGSTSASSGSQRRARWLRDKIRFNVPQSRVEEIPESVALGLEFGNPVYPEQKYAPKPELYEVNEISSDVLHRTPNNNETLNFKNKWKHRGKNTGIRRSTAARLQVPAEGIEDDTDADAESPQISNCQPFTNILIPEKHAASRRKKKSSSPVASICSISSDSEGEIDSAHNPSTMLNNSDGRGPTRKTSLFFTSYGVWGEDSVLESFRELTPGIASLLEAAWNGQVDTLQTHLSTSENVQNINCRDGKGRTPLHHAAASGHSGAVEILLQKGAEVDPCDTLERATPLMCAAASGSLGSVEALLTAGANVNAGFEVGKTPLHWAVQAGSYDCVKRLLEAGAKQNPPIIFSENPLHVAASTGDAACLQLLLDYGADVNLCKGTHRSSALHIAAEEGNPDCIKILLKAGALCDMQDARGHTPLHVAASVDAEATSVLLEGGANPNAKDRDGSRAAECLRVILETNAEINAQDNFGYTPLHLAAVNETSQCVSILLKYGADVTVKTKAGTTALTLLVRKIPDVMRFLVERLDAAVTIHDHEPGDPDCEIKLDFRAVVPNSERTFRGSGNSKLPERTYYQKPRKETDFLTCVLAAGNKKILAHPLSEAFLTLKWQRVRKFFWASLLFQIALVLLYTVYVVDVYLIKCPAKVHDPELLDPMTTAWTRNGTAPILMGPKRYDDTSPPTPDSFHTSTLTPPTIGRVKRSSYFSVFSFNPTKLPRAGKMRHRINYDRIAGNKATEFEIGTRLMSPKAVTPQPDSVFVDKSMQITNECHRTESWLTVIWCLLLVFTASMAIKEIFQLLQAPISYVMSSENWGQWLLITSVLVTAWPHSWPYPDRKLWQYPAAAIGIWIGWGLMLLQVGRFPALGLYVQMLGKVARNFGLVILGYACLLIAFALAFCVIFPGEQAYYSIPLAILKVLTMMVGEVDYEELFYEGEPLRYPITAHILHAAFVVIVTIVLMNLLVGLAVSDIQGLQKGAKLNRLSRQTALISRLESFIFSKKFQAILPRSIGLILQRSALLVPSSYNWAYYFRPNDPRDRRVSKELKIASLRVASTRHSSRHTVLKFNQNTTEVGTAKQQFPVVGNVSTEVTLRRLEQRMDSLQHQMSQILHTLTIHMEEIKETIQVNAGSKPATKSAT